MYEPVRPDLIDAVSLGIGIALIFFGGFLARGRWDQVQAVRRGRKRFHEFLLREAFREEAALETWDRARFYDQDLEDR